MLSCSTFSYIYFFIFWIPSVKILTLPFGHFNIHKEMNFERDSTPKASKHQAPHSVSWYNLRRTTPESSSYWGGRAQGYISPTPNSPFGWDDHILIKSNFQPIYTILFSKGVWVITMRLMWLRPWLDFVTMVKESLKFITFVMISSIPHFSALTNDANFFAFENYVVLLILFKIVVSVLEMRKGLNISRPVDKPCSTIEFYMKKKVWG